MGSGIGSVAFANVGWSPICHTKGYEFTWWNNLDEASKETLPEDFEQRVVAVLAAPAGKVPGTHDGLASEKATVI